MTVAMTLAFLIGAALLTYGAWLIYHPAGFIVAGAVLVAVPVRWARGA